MTTFFTAPTAGHPALASLWRAGFHAQRIEQVLALYDEPHRRYHDREHIGEMLDAALGFGVALSPAQALALLFHDAVYVPGAPRGSNEALSAQLLRVYAHGLPSECVDRAFGIVMDTADHVARRDESKIVLDLDLMRLAAAPMDFERFSRAIFAEQRALILIDDESAAWRFFCQRRAPFFASLLEREHIYAHPLTRGRFEAAARANLTAATESDSRETA